MITLDPNMDTAYLWASQLFQTTILPSYLEEVNIRADFINEINNIVGREVNEDKKRGGQGILINLNESKKNYLLSDIAEKSEQYIPYENDKKVKINIALRLWSGCIKAAKSISFQTLSGPNSSLNRTIAFVWIDLWSKIDPIYCAGVETAPVWKMLINQKDDISLEGIPPDSSVRKYIETLNKT